MTDIHGLMEDLNKTVVEKSRHIFIGVIDDGVDQKIQIREDGNPKLIFIYHFTDQKLFIVQPSQYIDNKLRHFFPPEMTEMTFGVLKDNFKSYMEWRREGA